MTRDSVQLERGGEVSDVGETPLASRGRAHYGWLGVAAFGALVLVAFRLFITPSTSGHGTATQLGLPPCPSMEWFGIPCPGCGVTTSVALAAHGELWKSFVNQPFGFAIAIGAAAFALWALWAQVAGRDLARDAQVVLRPRYAIAVVAIMLAAWVYKLATGF